MGMTRAARRTFGREDTDMSKAERWTRARSARSRSDPHPWGRERRWPLAGFALLAVLAIAVVSVGVGSVAIPPLVTIQILLSRLPFMPAAAWPATFETILFDIRLPRVALVALTGAALSCSGTAYQGLFRNQLADPYLIGVASGAGLGAVGAALLQAHYRTGGVLLIPLAAFAGALITVALVYALARIGNSTPVTTLLLAGVAVGTLATAATTYMMLRLGVQTTRVLAFLLGGYAAPGWGAVLTIAPLTLAGFALLYWHARPLNLLLFDEDQARQLGVNVERVTLAIVVAATLTTAAAVAFSGLIGFVGLIVPHTARLLAGADHRRLLPLATIGGAAFLLLADMLARTAIAPEELPLGVVTAFVGAPFFLWLLRRSRNAAFF